jgi:hypothetical protein
MNNSQITAKKILTQYIKQYNAKFDNENTVSNIALFIGVFGVIGFMLSMAFFTV